MKQFFISSLFCLALFLALPLPMQVKADASSSDEYAKCGCNPNKPSRDPEDKCGCNPNKPSRDAEDKCGCNSNKPSRNHDLARFIARLSALDEDETSPLHALNELVQEGDFVVSKDDFVAVLDHAQEVIIEHNNLISDEEIEHIGDTFNALVDVITQSDATTRDCASACDDDVVVKIRRILSVLNKAIFCDVVVFRNEAVFCKHVEMQDSLNVRKLRAHKAKIDELEAKKGKFKKLKAKKVKINDLQAEEITAEEITTIDLNVTGVANIANIIIDNITVCNLTVTCEASIETLEVLTSATVDCDLTVGCNIFMNDSLSPAIGNIYKGSDRFLHNFGTDNTFVGAQAGNFTMTGAANSGFGFQALQSNTTGGDNTAVGVGALSGNSTGTANTAVGQTALESNTIGGANVAVGQAALLRNTTGSSNTAVGIGALELNITGVNNTALGANALENNTSDDNVAVGFNALLNSTISQLTAVGSGALQANTTGIQNAALGYQAMNANTTGANNTAVGYQALLLNTTGANNTASGSSVLSSNTTGSNNTASGLAALSSNTTGNRNMASGTATLASNTIGSDNTALGFNALNLGVTGSNNIAVGSSAGNALTGAESNNIYIGNAGVLGESAAIRIGDALQATAFIAGVRGVTTGIANAIPVLIDSNGQLGTMSSSIRYKTNVEDVNERSAAIYDLRPVSYTYKADPTDTPHFGFIAEEVEDKLPSVVIRNGDGTIETIRYQDFIPLIINELIKLNARVTILEQEVNY